jgi:hypothetical protein
LALCAERSLDLGEKFLEMADSDLSLRYFERSAASRAECRERLPQHGSAVESQIRAAGHDDSGRLLRG